MVTVGDALRIMAPTGDVHPVPAMEQDVRMMVKFLGNFSDSIHEFQRRREVLEFEFTFEPAVFAILTPSIWEPHTARVAGGL